MNELKREHKDSNTWVMETLEHLRLTESSLVNYEIQRINPTAQNPNILEIRIYGIDAKGYKILLLKFVEDCEYSYISENTIFWKIHCHILNIGMKTIWENAQNELYVEHPST